jgi:hypothetical protein
LAKKPVQLEKLESKKSVKGATLSDQLSGLKPKLPKKESAKDNMFLWKGYAGFRLVENGIVLMKPWGWSLKYL